ncbi:hypothetical protein PO883_20535 [Massilia sp. DJPM01]|uniref:hypothetical protein n=1 Tax=Massilia sp. DJPM01 TaxID=3024404 RepID=UPI00259D456D|nr:hypothetical protein [Massilia sp. DJPM01]MDM5179581.1 hypothetical protein [Massilia sp. DJPM01]
MKKATRLCGFFHWACACHITQPAWNGSRVRDTGSIRHGGERSTPFFISSAASCVFASNRITSHHITSQSCLLYQTDNNRVFVKKLRAGRRKFRILGSKTVLIQHAPT